VQRLRDLVDRLLELSKLQSLREPEQRQPLMLAALVKEQLALLAAPIARRGLSLRWIHDLGWDDSPQGSTPLQGDRERIALALSNLLLNAIDFAPAGSTLEVGVRRDGMEMVFSLRDEGPGVPDFALPRLGERFFSTPRPSDGAKGTGLGLAIVRQVAALHRGSLTFEPAQPGLRVILRLALDP
jgi:two-component system sensor histidine kinase CreC